MRVRDWTRLFAFDGTLRLDDTLRLAVSNMRESRVFFYANVIAIAVGVLLVTVLVSTATGVRRYIDSVLSEQAAAELIEVSSDSAGALSDTRVGSLSRIEGVAAVVPTVAGVFGDLVGPNGSDVPVSVMSTIGSRDRELARYQYIAGSANSLTSETSIVVPYGVVHELGIFPPASAVGRRFHLRIVRSRAGSDETAEIPVVVAAVARQTRYSRCYLPLPMMRRLSRWLASDAPASMLGGSAADPPFGYNGALVYAKDVKLVPRIRRAIEQLGYRTASILDSARRYREILLIASIVLSSLGGIALFTGSISIFNSSYAAVMRRMHEFAVFKTYGATRGAILRIVLLEALLTALLAGASGFGAGSAICMSLQRLVSADAGGVIFPIEWWMAVVAEATAIVACLLASARPAQLAATLTPSKALGS